MAQMDKWQQHVSQYIFSYLVFLTPLEAVTCYMFLPSMYIHSEGTVVRFVCLSVCLCLSMPKIHLQ